MFAFPPRTEVRGQKSEVRTFGLFIFFSAQIKIKGRIASLLESGAGFHPELTGRPNICPIGTILS